MKYDVIIIGMGISGITAGIYAKNGGLNVLMLEKDSPGGLLNRINTITNYPGFKNISGPELSCNLFESIEEKQIDFKVEEVIEIKIEDNKKIVITNKNEYETEYIILASGRNSKKLDLENERELVGKGISNCALCDGHLYKNKDIAVVGGGNSAIEEAIYLANLAKKVYVIHRRDTFRADKSLVDSLKSKNNIEYLYNSQVTKINHTDDKLTSIVINDKEELLVDGLFTYIGFVPNIHYLDTLGLHNDNGYILVNENFETNIKGIYAVGDCIKKDVYQLVTAGSDGAIASTKIIKEYNRNKRN